MLVNRERFFGPFYKIVALDRPWRVMQPIDQQSYFADLDRGLNPISTFVFTYLDFLHCIWMGKSFGKHLEAYGQNAVAFRKAFPYKEILLWTDFVSISDPEVQEWSRRNMIRLIRIDDVFFSTFSLQNQSIFDRELRLVECNFAKRADILRYEIELRFGGVYFDIVDVNPARLACLFLPAPSGALSLFDQQRTFGFSSKSLLACMQIDEEFPDLYRKNLAKVDMGVNNDIISANAPGLPVFQVTIGAIWDRHQLPYDSLKALTKTRSGSKSLTPERPFWNKYRFWQTMYCTGPNLIMDVLRMHPQERIWRIPKNKSGTAMTWLEPIELRFENWDPASDSESDDMVSRVIQSSLDRLHRHRFDLTRYLFVLDKCKSTALYRDPVANLRDALLNELNQEKGKYGIKFVFAPTPEIYCHIWAEINRTLNRGFPHQDIKDALPSPSQPNLFKPLKRAIKTENMLMVRYFMSLFSEDMWLIRRERNGWRSQPSFSRAFRLIRAASNTGNSDLFWEVSQFVAEPMFRDGLTDSAIYGPRPQISAAAADAFEYFHEAGIQPEFIRKFARPETENVDLSTNDFAKPLNFE